MAEKKQKPKWGHKFHPLMGTFNERLYLDKDLDELGALLGGVNDKIPEVHGWLEAAADVYRIAKNNVDQAPSHAETKVALETVQRQAQTLLQSLENLDFKSWNFILRPEEKAKMQLLIQDEVTTELGRVITRRQIDEDTWEIDTLEPEDFRDAAALIETYVTHALENVPEWRPGRRKLFALSQWIANMDGLWCEYSGRRFTIERHKGEGTSPAAVFCTRAIRNVDPDVTPSNIVTAMRERIAKNREIKNRQK